MEKKPWASKGTLLKYPYFHISVNLCDQFFRPEQRNGERNEMSGEKEAQKTACRLLRYPYLSHLFRSILPIGPTEG